MRRQSGSGETPPAGDGDEQRRLAECALEPIRTPGSIQPHGALLAIDPITLVIGHASENCAAVLGTEATQILGLPIGEVTGDSWADEHLDVLLGLLSAANPLPLTLAGHRFDVIVHTEGGWTIVEFEPSLAADDYRSTPSVYNTIQKLTTATTDDQLWATAAHELRQLTRFDRVMIYHFHADGHGEVVAEALADGMEPYLGLHYPASDIPAQARALYLTKLSRMIVSSAGVTAALLSDPTTGPGGAAALDLGQAELRSVSPHHLQFMRNMGQESTLSLSLVRGGELIGMITLASRTPRRIPFELRQGLEILATHVAVRLGSMSEIRRLTRQMQLRGIRSRLMDRLEPPYSAGQADVAAALFGGELTVLDLIPATGAMLYLDGHATTIGIAPDTEAVVIAAELVARHTSDVFETDALPEVYPELGRLLPGVTGLLVAPLSAAPGFIAWFRPEISEAVNWLGDQTSANRLTPLSPRSSFDSWAQSVDGRSAPWSGLASEARELARDLAGGMLRQAEARLAALAMHDSLTGLPNRRLLMDRLEHSLAGVARGVPMTLLFIDIDGFKHINDTLGHDIGDAVLVHVGRQIRATTRAQDTVARLGGDEFVVLCEGATPDRAAEIARRVVDAVRQPALVSHSTVTVTASVGIAPADHAQDGAALLREADKAMYRAKSKGRDQTSQ